MGEKRKLLMAIAIAALALFLPGLANAAAWNSFTAADFTGVELSSDPMSGTLSYNVSFDPGATISFGGSTYDIAWLGGFYIRTASKTDLLTATDAGTVTDWKWVSRDNLAGWHAHGNDRIYAGDVKTLGFGSLVADAPLAAAYHVGYIDNGSIVTAFFSSGSTVPEPSAVISLSGMLAGAAGLIRRGRRLGPKSLG